MTTTTLSPERRKAIEPGPKTHESSCAPRIEAEALLAVLAPRGPAERLMAVHGLERAEQLPEDRSQIAIERLQSLHDAIEVMRIVGRIGIQIRGDAELCLEGALEHVDMLTRRYTRHPHFYGCIHPVEQEARETRVIWRIHPRRITLDAIHA